MARKGQVKTVEQYEAEAEWIGKCLVHCRKAPRKVWQRRHDTVLPSYLYVCHTCDTIGCILDAHHFIGTAKDNSQDMVSKGRHVGATGYKCHTTPHTKASKKRMSTAQKEVWVRDGYAKKQAEIRSTPEFKAKLGKPRPTQSKSMTVVWSTEKHRKKIAGLTVERSAAGLISKAALEVWERPGYREKMRTIQQSPAHRALMSKIASEREARKRANR